MVGNGVAPVLANIRFTPPAGGAHPVTPVGTGALVQVVKKTVGESRKK